ncbi:ABC transporter ATP-binding protein [Thermoleptolyngbya oregonensis NK1-22]|uniref:ABC-type quaternary amine transporter n=1 Tax=Thermoleptolyngbya oregonensis NK1-22 TaxID=2547457 RepID=A0AA97BKE2_9CYAN|nr:ABC transporter ATP-binding protein [Thermoleptolyngbya oregonensis]WOB41847.1 ABC transporter ATP-binding protein [Thermoleptolyngbya oregonensis NK1-22]
MNSSPVLQLQQVTHQFPNRPVPTVYNVSLDLEPGEILALLGPSGCGKTTLLRLIAGFEQPQQGEVAIAGRIVANADGMVPPEQRSVGMVFQDFALFPHLTVQENIAFGLGKGDSRGQVSEAIALVGLTGYERAYPHELSGGQQQRVALARALAPRPSLVLLDEPLSNLDVQVRLYLRQEVRDILKATGTTAVFVTHDQEEAMAIADQVAVMRQGHIEQQGPPEVLYHSPVSRFVAEFVTQANVLPARWNGQVWETEIGSFAPEPTPARPVDRGDTADLMIRPEDIQLQPSASGRVTVGDRQFLGRDYRYTLLTPSGNKLYARIPADRTSSASGAAPLPPGTSVHLTIHPTALKLFPTTEEAVDRSKGRSLPVA